MIHRRSRNLKREVQGSIPFIKESRSAVAGFEGSGETHFTVLVENHRDPELTHIRSSHGISIWVERKERIFLLDLGQGTTYFHNAVSLSRDIESVDFAFISHGHYDHGGGLDHFLNFNRKASVFIKEEAIRQRHYSRSGLFYHDKSIGLSKKQGDDRRLRFIDEPTEIDSGIFVIPRIELNHPRPRANQSLYKRADKGMVPDDFDHEQLLVMNDSDGLIVFSGCCHNGVLNVIETVNRYFNDIPIKAMIGGFHLFNPSRGKMAETPESVRQLGIRMGNFSVKRYLTGHCTGIEAYSLLKPILKERLVYFSAGMQFQL